MKMAVGANQQLQYQHHANRYQYYHANCRYYPGIDVPYFAYYRNTEHLIHNPEVGEPYHKHCCDQDKNPGEYAAW